MFKMRNFTITCVRKAREILFRCSKVKDVSFDSDAS